MEKLFKTAFWLLTVYSAVTIDLASLNQIAIEAFLWVLLIFPAFYYKDLKTYLNKPQ